MKKLSNKLFAVIFLVILTVILMWFLFEAKNNNIDDKLMQCGSIPNGSTVTLWSTSRKFINLPKDIFPDKDNNLQFKTINGNATAGRMPAVVVGEDLESTEKCWSYRYDFEGEGEIELTATSPIKNIPDYKVYFIVQFNNNE